MRHPYRTTALAIAAVVLLSGCSISYDYEIQLVVTNAETGQPLEGVTGLLDKSGDQKRRDDLEFGFPIGDRSNAGGQLTHDFSSSRTSDGRWCLKLQKQGF